MNLFPADSNAKEIENMTVDRDDWLHHVKHVIRSRHYTWLPEGLGGESIETAMTYLTTDIMHVCRRAGISWDEVLKRAREQFAKEEAEAKDTDA